MSTTISGDTGIDKVQDGATTPTGDVARILRLTAQSSTSGTFKDFTGIPSWAKKITVMFSGVSTNGSSNILVQIGAGTITTSGYSSFTNTFDVSPSGTEITTGFGISENVASGALLKGHLVLTNINGNEWVGSIVGASTTSTAVTIGSGSVTLTGLLSMLRITTVNGTDLFDAGLINVLVEG